MAVRSNEISPRSSLMNAANAWFWSREDPSARAARLVASRMSDAATELVAQRLSLGHSGPCSSSLVA